MDAAWVGLVQFGLGLGAALYVFWPLWSGRERGGETVLEGDVQDVSRRTVLEALGDLEYEHATGKINGRDFRRLRRYYLRRADELLEDEELESMLHEVDAPEERLERAVERARGRLQ